MYKIFKKKKSFVIIYLIIGTIIGFQQYFKGTYNNFTIFKNAVFHFFAHQNLYLEYLNEYYDVFLYNPSFSILFIPYAYLPTVLGVILWAVSVLLIYLWGIKSLNLKFKQELFFNLLILPELITSVQNLQTNPIIASFIVLSVTMLDRNKMKLASIYPALNFFIKGYGGIASVFFILKSPKIKTLLYLLISFIAIFSLPIIYYSFSEFIILYKQWIWSLNQDYNINIGVSLMGLIKSLIYSDISIRAIQLIGVGLFISTFVLIFFKKNYENVKYKFLAYVLIWIIIFNQSSESATYIIASTGVFIWFLKSNKSWFNSSLFMFFYILTVMSPSDLFPAYIRTKYVIPYSLKALPCVVIWMKIQFNLLLPNVFIKTNTKIWNINLI